MQKFYFFFNEGSKINQIICAILINWPVFGYGACIGWMSPMTLLLQSQNSPRGEPFTDTEISLIASIAYFTNIPSNFLVSAMEDKIGRKKTLLFISASALLAWILKLSSYQTWMIVLARAILGVLMAGAYVCCPLYTKEISDDSIRGVLGSFVILFHVSGNLFLYIIGDILSYNTILWICLSIPATHLVLFLMMPESPSYLIKQGKYEEAAKVMAWLRCRREDEESVQAALNRIKKEQSADEGSSKFVFKALFQDKILFRAFRIVTIVCLAREVCGTIPILNFAGDIFADASEGTGLVLSPNQQAMMLGAVQVAGSLMASSVVEKVGRKALLMVTSLISGIFMIALASWFVARDAGLWTPAWLPICTLCVCIFCDSSGLMPVSVMLTGEIFSFKYRGTVMASTMSTAVSSAFLQTLFFKQVATSVGIHVSFYFFGFVCIAATVYTFLVVPETKMKSVEEIYQLLKTKKEREEELKSGAKVESDSKTRV